MVLFSGNPCKNCYVCENVHFSVLLNAIKEGGGVDEKIANNSVLIKKKKKKNYHM